jgi:hypothetical protein
MRWPSIGVHCASTSEWNGSGGVWNPSGKVLGRL